MSYLVPRLCLSLRLAAPRQDRRVRSPVRRKPRVTTRQVLPKLLTVLRVCLALTMAATCCLVRGPLRPPSPCARSP